jgi:hypothetical protein
MCIHHCGYLTFFLQKRGRGGSCAVCTQQMRPESQLFFHREFVFASAIAYLIHVPKNLSCRKLSMGRYKRFKADWNNCCSGRKLRDLLKMGSSNRRTYRQVQGWALFYYHRIGQSSWTLVLNSCACCNKELPKFLGTSDALGLKKRCLKGYDILYANGWQKGKLICRLKYTAWQMEPMWYKNMPLYVKLWQCRIFLYGSVI